MLRISIHISGKVISIKLEGRIAEQWATELRELVLQSVNQTGAQATLEIDISQVTSVDHCGEAVLRWLAGLGAVLHASTASSHWLCESLGLHPAEPTS